MSAETEKSRIEFPTATLENAEQGMEVGEIAPPIEGDPIAEIPADLRYVRAPAHET